MPKFNYPPESISHKQLHALLSQARKGTSIPPKQDGLLLEEKAFQELLTNWQLISEELLIKLKAKPNQLFTERSSQSLMALGALEAHLTMAIQAKKAWDLN